MSQLILFLLPLLAGPVDGADALRLTAEFHAIQVLAQEEPGKAPSAPAAPAAPQEKPAVPAAPQEEPPAEKKPEEAAAATEKPAPAEPEDPQDDPQKAEVAASEESDDTFAFYEQWKKEGKFKGRFGLRYDYQKFESSGFAESGISDRDERNHELRTYLELETHGLGHEKLHTYVNMEWAKDLDGTKDPSHTKSLLTSYDPNGRYYLWSAYAEGRDLGDHLDVRVGRINENDVYPVTFDGGWARLHGFELLGMKAETKAYAGAISRFYTNLRQDLVLGGSLIVRPTDTLAFEVRDQKYDKNRLEVEGRWQAHELVSLLGNYGWFGSDSRDARCELSFDLNMIDTVVTGGWYGLFSHRERLDFIRDQDTRDLNERFLKMSSLEAAQDLYVRVHTDVADWCSVGGEYTWHFLRDSADESIYDADYQESAGWADFRYGPCNLRSELRYWGADRNPVPYVIPQFPGTPIVGSARVGEQGHTQVILDGTLDLEQWVKRAGWSVNGGVVWHTIDYIDGLAKVDDEKSVDYRLQFRAALTERVDFTLRWVYTRDMNYFSPYYDEMNTLTWMLDVKL